MSIVQKLTEGIVNRDLSAEGAALIAKWESTGLLEGIGDDTKRNGMARLLENQAKELLREASSMAAGGDVEGFAAVAFPLVRRVFGSLIANDLVSVQPMSLPSGLIFFLDFTFGGTYGAPTGNRLSNVYNTSLYGGGAVAAQLTGGVDLGGTTLSNAEVGPYALNNGYASPTGSVSAQLVVVTSGSVGADGVLVFDGYGNEVSKTAGDSSYARQGLLQFDADLTSGSTFAVARVPLSTFQAGGITNGRINLNDFVSLMSTDIANATILRHHTRFDPLTGSNASAPGLVVLAVSRANSAGAGARTSDQVSSSLGAGALAWEYAIEDQFGAGGAVGSVLATEAWGLENDPNIPEIDIKVDSVAVTAITKKLKAKWTPELGQDLNAYHNLDAEVELTQILSEQIALEIDREIMSDLVNGATAGVRYWSRIPGQFLNRSTGAVTGTGSFTGNVSEWYETLIETINDVSAEIHRKTLRGAANFLVCGPEVANLLEFTAGFRANVTADSDRGDAGAVKVGSLSKKFDIIVDPYFPRTLILVGRRGSSFLESGYVYAPYVPLQTTPTIFGVEDFVPRKGVMTRYAKKMVRPDMYGLVVVKALV